MQISRYRVAARIVIEEKSNQEVAPLDIETIVNQVRKAIGRHSLEVDSGKNLESGASGPDVFGEVTATLRQARIASGHLGVRYKVGWRTPILGQLWAVVRRRIHAEIAIYIDALTTQQIAFNGYVLRSLSNLVSTLAALSIPASFDRISLMLSDHEDQIRRLTAEIASLEDTVKRLEATRPDQGVPGGERSGPKV